MGYYDSKTIENREDFFFQAEDGIRDSPVTGVQTCALPISDARVQKIYGGTNEIMKELIARSMDL